MPIAGWTGIDVSAYDPEVPALTADAPEAWIEENGLDSFTLACAATIRTFEDVARAAHASGRARFPCAGSCDRMRVAE